MADKQMMHIRVPKKMDQDLDELVANSEMFVSKAEAVRYAINGMLQNEIVRNKKEQ